MASRDVVFPDIGLNIGWLVASLLKFCSDRSPMKETAGAFAVDRGQVLRGGQGIGVFSLMEVIFSPISEGS